MCCFSNFHTRDQTFNQFEKFNTINEALKSFRTLPPSVFNLLKIKQIQDKITQIPGCSEEGLDDLAKMKVN
jgi:hypothetical protein